MRIIGWLYGFLTGIALLIADNINDLRVDSGMDAMWTLYIAFPLVVALVAMVTGGSRNDNEG